MALKDQNNEIEALSGEGLFVHLDELRSRIIKMLIAIGALAFVSFFFAGQVLNFLLMPMKPYQEHLYFLTPEEPFLVHLTVSFICGAFLASPWVFYQLWKFVSPALYLHEKHATAKMVIPSVLCFVAGVSFGFFLVMPLAIRFLMGFENTAMKSLITINGYISFLASFLLAFGVGFMFPVVLVGLVKLGVIGPGFLKEQRKMFVIIILVLSAFLTPPDVISQVMLALPLLILFEAAVFFAQRVQKK